MMIYFIFMQYMKHRMQIMQVSCEFVLTTNSMYIYATNVQPFSEGDSSVCN